MKKSISGALLALCFACGGGDKLSGADSSANVSPAPPAEVRWNVTVRIIGTGSGRVNSDPAGLACQGTCSMQATAGSRIALVARPDEGSMFVGFGGDCSGNGACTVEVSGDVNVWANFALGPPPPLPTRGITVSLAGAGFVTSTVATIHCPGVCSAQVPSGAATILKAQPDKTARFVGWSGACAGTSDCTIPAGPADVAVAATFADLPKTCSDLAPADVPMREWVRQDLVGSCGAPVANGDGVLALPFERLDYQAGWSNHAELVRSDGTHLGTQSLDQGRGSITLFAQQHGFTVAEGTYMQFGYQMRDFDPVGAPLGVSAWVPFNLSVPIGPGAWKPPATTIAPDPRGGVLVAGGMARDGAVVNSVMVFDTNGAPSLAWGPRPLAAAGDVVGSGVDPQGNALVLTDGSARFGPDHVSAQWFDPFGRTLTDEFDLAVVSGQGAFEAWPLIDGGLLVARITWVPGDPQKLAVVKPGETQARPVPAWMSARPGTRLQIASGGSAYAVLPAGAIDVPCTQHLEIVAPDGTSCGARDYPIAPGTCTTFPLALGLDGSVLQRLPDAMETKTAVSIGIAQSCTWRWWPAAVR